MLSVITIQIPEWGRFTLIELVWLLSGVLAVFYTLKHVKPLYDDYHFAVLSRDESLRITARGYLRRELMRLFFGGNISGVGFYAAIQPSLAPGPARISIVGIVITVSFLAVSFGTAVMSWWDWHDRNKVIRLLMQKNGIPIAKEEK